MVNGLKIRQLREESGLDTTEFAKAVYTSQAMVSCIENGVKPPGIELLKRIANFFNCTVDNLLLQADDPEMEEDHARSNS